MDTNFEKDFSRNTLANPGDNTSPEDLYTGLVKRVKKYHPSDDISMIERAYEIARSAHENQFRKSGEPYIIHPLSVGIILADLELDKETIVAGLLHDVVEDTEWTNEDVTKEFGSDVAHLVDGVTKLNKLQYHGDKMEFQADNLRKMFMAMAKDIRVILIKLADRLHNMRTLKYQPEEKQKEIARETLDIYSPIAQRLGISRVKVELDDLSLKYLKPEVYQDLKETISAKKEEREEFIENVVEEVRKNIEEAHIDASVTGRVKHFFSIYKKMVNQNKTIDQIYDLFAVRIIVDNVKDCYAALGIMHELYKPIPGRFKDYIAMPKPNRYQSLHSTLIGPGGQPFEIQIRTYEMHKIAEYGIAAHWKYKEVSDGRHPDESEEAKLSWLRQILEWQRDMSDNKEYMQLIKSDLDLFSDSVYCFTPTGDVKNLPAGSTPVDFAYMIHSAVGNRMIGARVNGKLVNIDYKIQNGDRIEIVTSQNSNGPSRDWLNIVKSPQARTKINQWFKKELKEDNILKGKESFNEYIRAHSIDPADIMKPEYMEAAMKKYGLKDWDSVYAAIGHGALKEGQVVNRMVEAFSADHKKNVTNEEVIAGIENEAQRHHHRYRGSNGGIVVKGITDVAVRFSKCCSPLPGDEIIGFVTRGYGVSVHKKDCLNVINSPANEKDRWINVSWAEGYDTESYNATIDIIGEDRTALIADVTAVIAGSRLPIRQITAHQLKNGNGNIIVTVEVASLEQLNALIGRICKIQGIISAERTGIV